MPPSPKFPSLIADRYKLLRLITEGNMAWSIEACDTHQGNKKTFIKYYKSPTPSVGWYYDYVKYVNQLNKRLEASSAAKYCVLSQHLFAANPKPGMCPHEFLYQAYDFIESGYDLKQLLAAGEVTWEKRKTMAKVFLAAMKKIHSAGIVHSDLKPENIQMLPDERTKLGLVPRMIDMDRSLIQGVQAPWTQGEQSEGYVGTPDYFSPEHLKGMVPELASDVFTIGLILGELLGGKHPYSQAHGDQVLYKKMILEGDQYERVEMLGHLGGSSERAREFADLIHACFSPYASSRPSCAELHRKLLQLDKVGSSPTPVSVNDSSFVPEQAPTRSTPPPPPPPSSTPPSSTPPPLPNNVAQDGYYPLILNGDLGSMSVKLNMTLGRDAFAQISSEAKYASRQQLVLTFDKAQQNWLISQAGSRCVNLTTLNGQIIKGSMKVGEGDEIALISRSSHITAMLLRVSR